MIFWQPFCVGKIMAAVTCVRQGRGKRQLLEKKDICSTWPVKLFARLIELSWSDMMSATLARAVTIFWDVLQHLTSFWLPVSQRSNEGSQSTRHTMLSQCSGTLKITIINSTRRKIMSSHLLFVFFQHCQETGVSALLLPGAFQIALFHRRKWQSIF